MNSVPTTSAGYWPYFPLGLGLAEFGLHGSADDAFGLLDLWRERGGRLLDTARVYSDWVPGQRHRSETLLGMWLKSRGVRKEVFIATKGCHPPLNDWWARCNDPGYIRQEIVRSLETLHCGWIDLWLFHRDDPHVPVGECLDALAEPLRRGWIRSWGVSNWTAPRIDAALNEAGRLGLPAPVAVQNEWSLGSWHRRSHAPQFRQVVMDDELLSLHRKRNLAAMPYSAQAGGFFSHWIEGDDARREKAASSAMATPGNFRTAHVVERLAHRHGVRVNAVVLAYFKNRGFSVVPLVGCHQPEQVRSAWEDAKFVLPADDLAELDLVVRGPVKQKVRDHQEKK